MIPQIPLEEYSNTKEVSKEFTKNLGKYTITIRITSITAYKEMKYPTCELGNVIIREK